MSETTPPAVFRAYLLVTASAFAALGVQMVLFPYLVAVELHERPALIGAAQMAVMLPALLFLLPAGAIADRVNGRAFLSSYHVIAAVPPLLLAAIIGAGGLSYLLLIGYAVLMGTLSAFAIPVREAMVAHVMPSLGMQRVISAVVSAQFLSQLTGMALVGIFDRAFPESQTLIAEVMLGLQGLIFFGGVLAARVLPAQEAKPLARGGLSGRWHEIREGLSEAMSNPSIMPIIVAMMAVGALFVGSFFTIIPVLIRDAYQGDAGTFSIVNVVFWTGTIAANIALMRRATITRQGQAVALALMCGAVILALMSFPSPFWVFCTLCFAWGVGAGVTITLGRTIVQEAAPPSHRGRIMSIYQLGFSGAAPVGALALGLIVEAVGPHSAAQVGPVLMAAVIAILATRTRLLAIRSAAASSRAV